jgi:hypothetical protein
VLFTTVVDIVEIPTVVLLVLFQGLVAALLWPRPSLKQIEQSSSSGKFRERHTCVLFSMNCDAVRHALFEALSPNSAAVLSSCWQHCLWRRGGGEAMGLHGALAGRG